MTEEGLILVTNRGDPVEAIPQGQDVYALANGPDRIQFQRDPSTDRITGLTLGRLTLQRAP